MAAPAGATHYLPITMPSGIVAANMPDVGSTFAADLVIDQAAAINYEGGAGAFIDGLEAGCTDLRVFTDDTLIEVPFGIKQFSQVAGSRKLILGLGIPSTYPLLSSSDTTYRLYRGCTGGTFENKAGTCPAADGYVRNDPLEEQNSGAAAGAALYRDWVNNALTGLDYVSNTGKGGQIGDGQQFDGANDYINCGDADALDGFAAFTIMGWIKYSSEAAALVVDKNQAWYVYAAGTNRLYAHIGAGGGIVYPDYVGIIGDGLWHHFAFTYDAAAGINNCIPYLDTAVGNMKTTTGNIQANASPLQLGGRNGTYPFLGSLDEIILCNVARSANWIAAYYAITNNNAAAWTVGDVVAVGGGGPHILRSQIMRVGPSLAGLR